MKKQFITLAAAFGALLVVNTMTFAANSAKPNAKPPAKVAQQSTSKAPELKPFKPAKRKLKPLSPPKPLKPSNQ